MLGVKWKWLLNTFSLQCSLSNLPSPFVWRVVCIVLLVVLCLCTVVSPAGLWSCDQLQECQGQDSHVCHSGAGTHLVAGHAHGLLHLPADSGRHEEARALIHRATCVGGWV